MNQRKEHSADRRAYERENPICEKCRCRPTCTTHHVVQGSRSYESREIYLAICFECHNVDIHTNAGKTLCIAIKVLKGEWFKTEQDERNFFGGRVHYLEW